MGADRNRDDKTRALRPLTRKEIEQRLDRVVAEVGGRSPDPDPAQGLDTPRWISPSELVRRVRPFIVYN